ncbi:MULTISPECIES: VanZ family protein [Paenibacillus]|uniref:VanZ family protein n=1 Tax=Paenibacillus violae TaxID=3077234 RepID=A0ABU3R9J9_9BACL|nr:MULTISPECIES: VanZ family protein [Paenibacillus]MDU0200944.1 VanZ family protein [Paenibacillus sp. PFR10]MEC0264802.1 VanZ family protein [Paenibacillus anseongense]
MEITGNELTLELLQVFFSMGNFNVDDIILNIFGGLLGYCFLRLFLQKPSPKRSN